MAYGTVTFSYYSGVTEPLVDNSCASVLSAAYAHNTRIGGTGWTPISCSSDPVQAGTIINWIYGTANGNLISATQTSTWSVLSITATAGVPSGSTSSQVDLSPLSSVVIACFVVLLFFIGYGTGLHVNR